MRSDRERLYDILESIQRIEAQAARGRVAFADDELAQTGYFDIDVDLVWSVADNDLPRLAAQIRAIVKEVP